jgi:hypothetical protein
MIGEPSFKGERIAIDFVTFKQRCTRSFFLLFSNIQNDGLRGCALRDGYLSPQVSSIIPFSSVTIKAFYAWI